MKKCFIWLLAALMLLTACAPATTNTSDTPGEDEYTGDTRYTLVSVGKPYTASTDPEERYPDIFNLQMTDGQKTPDYGVHYTDTRMVGYTKPTTFVIDLGEDGKRISAVSVRCLDFYSDGVRIAGTVKFSGSVDGTNYEAIGTAPFVPTGDQTVSTARIELKDLKDYTRIKAFVTMGSGGYFYFLDEIEVFACVPETEKASTVELAYKEDSTDRNAWKSISTGEAAKPVDTQNVAAGSRFVIENCEFDERAPKNDTYLTDGAHTGRLFGEDVWIGIKGTEGETPSVKVALSSKRSDIFAVKVHALGDVLDITYPDYIDAYADDVFLGRMYAPSASDNFAYTLILPEYIEGLTFRFDFPEGEGNYWIEEVEVYAGSQTEFQFQLYPDLDFEEVTEEVYWDETEPDYNEKINLILGNIQQVACSIYCDPVERSNNSPADFKYLTDGKLATDMYCYSGQWFFSSGGGALDFIYDLGALSSVQSFNVSLLEQEPWGIARPKHIRIYLSENGDDWYNVASYTRPADQVFSQSETRIQFPFELDKAYKARYVMFRVESAVLFIDELEAFGTKAVTAETSNLADGGFKCIPYYINEESQQFATKENTGFDCEEMVITYPNYTTPENLLPMLAYIDEEGNIKDTFADGLLLCYRNNLATGHLPHEATNKADWEQILDTTFNGMTGFDVIDTTVGEIKTALNKPDHKVYVYVSISPLLESVTDFGDVDGDEISESLAIPEDRQKVLDWYINKAITDFNDRGYENIELGGFYWLYESVNWENDDQHIIAQVGERVEAAGEDFFWVPYYVANRYVTGYESGFDLISMQPNYVFDLEHPYYRIEHTPQLAARYKMTVEIEHTYQCFSDILFARRYMLYLYYGATEGYMDAIHVYYDDVENLGQLAYSDEKLCRLQYDATYQFAKGTLDVTPDPREKVSVSTASETVLYGTVGLEDEIALYTLVSCPANGNVSLNTDGSFVYYPAKGFTGTDTFTYTYNNLLGESEECVVEITVG